MRSVTHDTVPTQFIEANGIRFGYRRFGNPRGVPIVLNQHFRGTMDFWDPAVTDGLSQTREVILFDNAGVASSSGEVPPRFPQMGANAIAFIRALGLSRVDILGFSIGGMVSQEIVLQAPDLVRKLILVGTGPRGADMSASRSAEIFAGVYDPPEHLWLAVHFSTFGRGARGGARLSRAQAASAGPRSRGQPQAPPHDSAKRSATTLPGERAPTDQLRDIRVPTLVVQGSNDVIIPTINSYVLQQKLPNAQLILYPDANHGSFYQYPDLFLKHATLFLDA